MQAERIIKNGSSQLFSEELVDEVFAQSSGSNHIEHTVSKMDTLAGVAIKYGVEVADIKRLNGLVTDRQMFAHKSLQIPLPARHPPFSIPSNASPSNGEQSPASRPHTDALDSFSSLKLKPPQHKVTPARRSLQDYYGLTPPKRSPMAEGTEMAVYRSGKVLNLEKKKPLPRESPISDPPPNRHGRSRSLVNECLLGNGELADDMAVAKSGDNSGAEKCSSGMSVRRHQKADADPILSPSELVEGSWPRQERVQL